MAGRRSVCQLSAREICKNELSVWSTRYNSINNDSLGPIFSSSPVSYTHLLDFLQKVTSNNIAALTPGQVQSTCFPNENGGIVDDLLAVSYTHLDVYKRQLSGGLSCTTM